MVTKRLADRTTTHGSAPLGHVELFPAKPATPCAKALELLGITTRAEAVQLFKGRAAMWQVRDWRLGRRGMPTWAVEILRAELNARRAMFDALAESVLPGPGLGWNKNATRGLGEWRAKKNVEKS